VQSQPGCADYSEADLTEAASVASDILYRLSGRLYTGTGCGPVTVRPICRPHGEDRSWAGLSMGMGIVAFGMCAGMTPGANIASHYGHSAPREVDLGVFPVNQVTSVLINGVTIPPDEYELQDYRRLVRMLPTMESVPTEMYGWPTSQRLDLPDTEQATFSVTYTYGQPPPPGGLRACKVLAQNFVKAFSGDPNVLPTRTTGVTRQGVASQTVDVEDILAKGLTGIYQVDLWILSVNPGKQKGKTSVFSPDVGRPRRLPTGTT
jgi:hypothetical protein